jgi:(p)ppGpp synthase/HD superfamily hydrolase
VDSAINWSITASDVIESVLTVRRGESLVHLGEACALLEKACSDPAFVLGPYFRTLMFNIAVELAPLLDADAIAVAMLYQLPGVVKAMSQESLERVLSVRTKDTGSVLAHDLLRFSNLEWNTWPDATSAYRSERTQEMLRRNYLFAVGPVTDEERQSQFFVQTKHRNRETQGHNLVSLLGTASTDWRVAYVKIAERICLTRMLGRADIRTALPVDAIACARINLAVYTALAEQRATWALKSALEDASLELLDPAGYHEIEEWLRRREVETDEKLKTIIACVEQCLADERIYTATVHGRRKHIYSIYRKMKNKGRSLDQINDLLGIRIVVHPVPTPEEILLEEQVATAAAVKAAAEAELQALEVDTSARSGVARIEMARARMAATEANKAYKQAIRELNKVVDQAEATAIDTCYRVFAVLRTRWVHVVDFFDGYDMRDWIERPRENGYQSIHTTLLIEGMTVEVQIRTERMDERNRFGTAAYAQYKSEKNYGPIQPVATVSNI